mmetsp:Transcript_48335/g.100996  ORF Transcript_48335/g.100996 Transcript_48335/m.100996 type:complete len:311 (-) Transcript_48335:472-1404(-)
MVERHDERGGHHGLLQRREVPRPVGQRPPQWPGHPPLPRVVPLRGPVRGRRHARHGRLLLPKRLRLHGRLAGEPAARAGAARGQQRQLVPGGVAQGQEARERGGELRVGGAREAHRPVGGRRDARVGHHAQPQRRPAGGLLRQGAPRGPGERVPRQRQRVPRRLPRRPHERPRHLHLRRRLAVRGRVQGRQAARPRRLLLLLGRPLRRGVGGGQAPRPGHPHLPQRRRLHGPVRRRLHGWPGRLRLRGREQVHGGVAERPQARLRGNAVHGSLRVGGGLHIRGRVVSQREERLRLLRLRRRGPIRRHDEG